MSQEPTRYGPQDLERIDLLPRAEADARLGRLQRWMQQAEVDAALVLQNADLFYFAGTVQVGVLCLPAAGEPLYLVQKSLARARIESPWERLVPLRRLEQAPDLIAAEGFGHPGRIGLELDVLPAATYLKLQALFPSSTFVDASDAIRRTRMLKSPYEVAEMRRAARMLARTFEQVPAWLVPGITELELHARVESFLRRQGHQGITRMRGLNHEVGFGTISSGASACYPTPFPGPVGFVGLYPAVPNGGSRRAVESGSPVMFDIVGGAGGYIADQTRVFAAGRVDPELAAAHRFAVELLGELEGMLRPGRPGAELYPHALERVRESPYAATFMGIGEDRVRFVGHGVGLELDELPVVSGRLELPLEAGMTIALEPKIFFPGRGGVGIENTYLVTETGFENLTPFPSEILGA
jgi:Xaa-Pro aminopeptidase